MPKWKDIPKRKDRIKGQKYVRKGVTRIWSGWRWNCEHDKQKPKCKLCGGSDFCSHRIQKAYCKLCGGSGICDHLIRKTHC